MAEPSSTGEHSPTEFMGRVDLSVLNDIQTGLISSIRLLDEQSESMTGNQVKEVVAEMFPPALLFGEDLRSLRIVYRELRDWLDRRGANLQQHPSRRVMMTLASELYTDPEDHEAAVEIVQQIIAAGRRPASASTGVEDVSAPGPAVASVGGPSTTDRTPHNVAMRFKDASAKFSGELGQAWIEYVAEYQQVARDYELTARQKLQYLHNLLSGDAKRFYLDRIEGYASTFQQAVEMINNEYNSTVRQNRVKNYLATLRMTRFIEDDGIETSDALEKTYKLIAKLAPQVPSSHRGEAHKVEFLRNAVVGQPWATEPLSRIATHSLTFQQLYGELEAALQLEKESQMAQTRDNMRNSQKPDDAISGVYYEGQGRYLNPSKRFQRRYQRPSNPLLPAAPPHKAEATLLTGCFNCDDPGHRMNKCPHPINTVKAAMRRLEYFTKKAQSKTAVHNVLFELCQQVDSFGSNAENSEQEGIQSKPEHSESEDDAVHFQALLETGTSSKTANEPSREMDHVVMNSIWSLDSVIFAVTSDDFQGACLDTGAARTVIGKPQAKAYFKFTCQPYCVGKTDRGLFSFGRVREPSIGTVKIRYPMGEQHFFEFGAKVADLDIPLLIGLDVLDRFQLVVNTVDNELCSKQLGWHLPLVRKYGHIYLEWEAAILYTQAELRKIHRHFFHPNAERLYAVMKRAGDPDTSSETLGGLRSLTEDCDICQRLAKAPHRFRVSLPSEDIVFNRTVYLDLTTLSGRTVLHILDKDTLFSAASFVKSETTEEIWETYVRIWVTPYLGFSATLHSDQGHQFTSNAWDSLLRQAGISKVLSGVEGHNALGAGERYHSFLRQIFLRVKAQFPRADDSRELALAVMAMNATAGPNGLCPSLLVFGAIPRFPTSAVVDVPKQRERMQILHKARTEMAKLVAKARLGHALRSNVPASADESIQIGMKVLFYREKPINCWTGPFTVVARDEKLATIVDEVGTEKNVSVDKVKPYLQSPEKDPYDKSFGSVIDAIIEDTGEADETEPTPHAFLTQVMEPDDERANSEQFLLAKKKEIDGLVKRGTFKFVQRNRIPARSNTISGRFVCTLKHAGTEHEVPKARFVAQGHSDREKPFIVHNVSSLRQSSTKIIVSMAALHSYRVYTHDVTQAYVQSEDNMSREIYLDPKPCDRSLFNMSHDEVLKVLKSLYGICDSGDYWNVTIDRHVRHDLHMEPLDGDPSLYLKEDENKFDGLMGNYIDDGLLTGSPKFEDLTELTLVKFQSKPRVYDNVTFLGVDIETCYQAKANGTAEMTFSISQPEYIRNLRIFPLDVTFESFRSIRAAVAWLAHSRPDICCSINRSAQATRDSFSEKHVKELNGAIERVKKTPDIKLLYKKLDMDTLHLRAYTDASFAINNDETSQLGYIVLLCDSSDKCHLMSWSSKKSRRVVRSIMAGEMYAFADGFDGAFIIKHDLERILKKAIPLTMLTDSKQVFDVITKASHPTEKRLMIDVAAARDAYNRYEISNVGLVSSEHNLADGLTKPGSFENLLSVMRTGINELMVQQWITRLS